jgi:hypothetical protein
MWLIGLLGLVPLLSIFIKYIIDQDTLRVQIAISRAPVHEHSTEDQTQVFILELNYRI